jgi:hypothetical protein
LREVHTAALWREITDQQHDIQKPTKVYEPRKFKLSNLNDCDRLAKERGSGADSGRYLANRDRPTLSSEMKKHPKFNYRLKLGYSVPELYT